MPKIYPDEFQLCAIANISTSTILGTVENIDIRLTPSLSFSVSGMSTQSLLTRTEVNRSESDDTVPHVLGEIGHGFSEVSITS
jgi:hypothetical protein